jgi:hypothetical protein
MNIQEVQIAKANAQDRIKAILLKLESETGMTVNDLTYDKTFVETFSKRTVADVKVKIRLEI